MNGSGDEDGRNVMVRWQEKNLKMSAACCFER